MADSFIGNLDPAAALTGVEPFPSEQSSADVKVTVDQIKTYIYKSPILIGSQANTTKYPTALEVISDVTTADVENHMIGFAAERTATYTASGTPLTGWGIGLYGKGWTNGNTRSAGTVGEGMVTASGDVGSAIGLRGYAKQTHAGGANIGVLGDATGGLTNFDLYSVNGTIASATGTLTNTGNFAATGTLSVPAGTSSTNAIQFGGSATTGFYSTGAGSLAASASYFYTNNLAIFNGYAIASGNTGSKIVIFTPPTIASGFGTSPTITQSSTAAFKITVGTGGAASGVLTFPAASNGWAVDGTDATNYSTIEVVCVSTSTTSVTVYAFDRVTGLASTFSAGDVLQLKALGF